MFRLLARSLGWMAKFSSRIMKQYSVAIRCWCSSCHDGIVRLSLRPRPTPTTSEAGHHTAQGLPDPRRPSYFAQPTRHASLQRPSTARKIIVK